MTVAPIAITGWSLHLPAVALDARFQASGTGPACPPERAGELLGSKGLLNKEPATRLALCAVHRALRLPARAPRVRAQPDPRVAVVASSNLGNLATVQAIARTLRDGLLKDVSALDAPNASSNVIASTVALWFRFGGPNLMVCSGASAGLDALFLAGTLLRAGRADRVVVVGAEPDDEVARCFHASRVGRRAGDELRAGAAAVLLERARDGHAPRLSQHVRHPVEAPPSLPDGVAMLIGPQEFGARAQCTHDLAREWGDTYGAQGIVQVAAAAALMATTPAPARIAIVCGDHADGWRSAVVEASTGPASAGPASKGPR